jgi:hypothetical protein
MLGAVVLDVKEERENAARIEHESGLHEFVPDERGSQILQLDRVHENTSIDVAAFDGAGSRSSFRRRLAPLSLLLVVLLLLLLIVSLITVISIVVLPASSLLSRRACGSGSLVG